MKRRRENCEIKYFNLLPEFYMDNLDKIVKDYFSKVDENDLEDKILILMMTMKNLML